MNLRAACVVVARHQACGRQRLGHCPLDDALDVLHPELSRRSAARQVAQRLQPTRQPGAARGAHGANVQPQLLGDFLARKGDGEPGAKTIWLGLQEIAIFVEGARYARQLDVA